MSVTRKYFVKKDTQDTGTLQSKRLHGTAGVAPNQLPWNGIKFSFLNEEMDNPGRFPVWWEKGVLYPPQLSLYPYLITGTYSNAHRCYSSSKKRCKLNLNSIPL